MTHLLANRCLFFFRLTEEEFFDERPDASQAASQQRHGPAIARPKSVTK